MWLSRTDAGDAHENVGLGELHVVETIAVLPELECLHRDMDGDRSRRRRSGVRRHGRKREGD